MDKKIFKLARLLKLLTEAVTDKGVLVSEGEIEVGSEVFVYDEEGNAVPASDGEYVVDGGEMTIVVANGIVSEMRQKEEAPIEQPEEPETVVVEEEVADEEETPAEAPVEETPEEEAEKDEEVDIEALKAEIEALKTENAELKAKVAEYEAKEKEAEEPSIEEEDKEEFSKQNGLSDKQKRTASILKYRDEK